MPASPPSPRALVVLASLAAAAGCLPPSTARSSASILGPERSTAVVRRAPADTAALLARLFAARGYGLADQQAHGAGFMLRLTGFRHTLHDRSYTYELGSAYYAFILPRRDGRSEIALVGRPMDDGDELCTRDVAIAAPCLDRYVQPAHASAVTGYAEADVVYGVLAELRRAGELDEAAALTRPVATARDACLAQRRAQVEQVERQPDPRARAVAYARLDRDFPRCE